MYAKKTRIVDGKVYDSRDSESFLNTNRESFSTEIDLTKLFRLNESQLDSPVKKYEDTASSLLSFSPSVESSTSAMLSSFSAHSVTIEKWDEEKLVISDEFKNLVVTRAPAAETPEALVAKLGFNSAGINELVPQSETLDIEPLQFTID